MPMAIASGSTPNVIDAVVERLELKAHLQFTYSAVNEPKGKPDPGVFLTSAKKLGVAPVDCIVFEDAVYGVRAAKAAGMKCVAIPELANRDKPEFKDADLLIDSLEELSWEQLVNLYSD